MSSEEEVFTDPVEPASEASSHKIYDESELCIDTSDHESFRTIFSFATEKSTPSNSFETSRPSQAAPPVFRVPEVPKYKVCTVCKPQRVLKTQRGFEAHMKRHKWKDAAKGMPDASSVINHCLSSFSQLLENLKEENNPELQALIKEMKQRCAEDECDEFLEQLVKVISSGLQDCSTAMPSSILTDIQRNMSDFLSSESFVQSLFSKFPVECSFGTFSLFAFDVLKSLTDTAVIFICKTLRKATETDKSDQVPRSSDDFDHYLTHQVLHYIAGSALRSQIRRSFQYPKNEKLKRMKECILSKFARIGSPPILDQKDKQYWTSLMSRKSLLFPNDCAFEFFVLLGKLLVSCEDADGIKHDKVMEALVENGKILNAWDCVVENSLDEDESFNLLVKVVRAVTNTYGKGIMIKRMNAISNTAKNNKSSLAISHRARLT